LQVSIPSTHHAKLWRLNAPGLTATSNVTLAGAEITPGKSWRPSTEERLASKNGRTQVEIAPGSAAALFFDGRI